MNSDFDLSGLNSRYRGSPFNGASSLFPRPPTFHKPRKPFRIRQSPTAYRLPVEVYSEIFLYTVQADPHSRTKLMHVCRHWHDIMLSTPGIHSQLRIHRETKKKDLERLGQRWLLDVIVDSEHVPVYTYRDSKPVFDPVEYHACFMAAAEAASRWRSLALLSLPPLGEYKDLQIIHPLQHLESFKLATGCNLGNFLEPLLNAITTTTTPRFTVMEVFHPDAALCLLQPAHLQIFSSLTTLRLVCRRMQNPVDVLPSLHRLEVFEAHHLSLPIYPPGIDLHLTQTLRDLHLGSVSVHWMAGQMFPVLEKCSIIFPHHADAIHAVYMPSCSVLRYDSNNLSALEHFHISTLKNLEVKCGQWRTWSGNLQLIRLHPIIAVQSLTCLHLEIKCSEQLLVYMLRLVPDLEELWMGLSSPHALSTDFFLALATSEHQAHAGSSCQTVLPLSRKLRTLHLHYKRWLRGPEMNALIPAFSAVVASHPPEDRFNFHLSLDEGSKSPEWYIREPAERFGIDQGDWKITIGVPSPGGIVHLSQPHDDGVNRDFDEHLEELECIQLPRETEYIMVEDSMTVSSDVLFYFHRVKEVRMRYSDLIMKRDAQLSLNAPLFHTLRVLRVETISSSFFAGQTFHRLERYGEDRICDGDIPGLAPLTEMPVCTRLVVPLRRLVTLRLPQIRELGLSIDAELDHIWEQHIAINANLSGLKLLHLLHDHATWTTWTTMAAITILGSLPALETLIVDPRCLIGPHVNFFEAFVPTNVVESTALNQSSWKGQISGVLCPRLESLQIQGISLTEQAELMPVLEEIVTLRAINGSPLNSFTIYFDGDSVAPQMWQLIGRDKSFMMEEIIPAKWFVFDVIPE